MCRILGRFTPTHVGNTLCSVYLEALVKVHPHTRGEYVTILCEQDSYRGSPPHTWGIRTRRSRHICWGRFTPTHVGNTQSQQCTRHCQAVHPHTRGEYLGKVWVWSMNDGSPPHTWGIHVLEFTSGDSVRFTPTHVGNTFATSYFAADIIGSPPHTWGIRITIAKFRHRQRFTPTHVGNTPCDPHVPA